MYLKQNQYFNIHLKEKSRWSNAALPTCR